MAKSEEKSPTKKPKEVLGALGDSEVRPWVSKNRERKKLKEFGVESFGFGLKQSPSEVKIFGAQLEGKTVGKEEPREGEIWIHQP